ncbi:MAG: hypothetical protein WC734_06215 [Patescibacteria group bacterium]|jgi:hypothetical protein
MATSLKDSGLGQGPRNWRKAADIEGTTFYVTHAQQFESVIDGKPRSQVIFDCLDIYGERFAVSLDTNENRSAFVRHFKRGGDDLGPLTLESVTTKNGQPYWNIIDVAEDHSTPDNISDIPF